jgi:N-acetylglucosamine-6-phosphate deacetylase
MDIVIKGAVICNSEFEPQRADLSVRGEKIYKIGGISGGKVIDFSGCTVLPGFIDIHIHGCGGADVDGADTASLKKMSDFLVKKGVTSFCPTTMTMPESSLAQQFAAVSDYMGRESGAYIHGINMEGPFISHEKKGAQHGGHIRTPDLGEFKRLVKLCDVRLIDVAPETKGAFDFAAEASKHCVVSAAHTAADYETAMESFKHGFSHATHLFNAMPPMKNREPGMAGAVLDSKGVTAELICDGFHNHPAVIRLAFGLLGEDRAVVISDAMKAAGCGDGDYELGGQTVYVRGGRAALKDGTIAASTTNLFDEFKNLLDFGIPFKQAVKACTINPAKVIGADDVTGSIKEGKSADLLIIDDSLEIKAVFVKGRIFTARQSGF